MLGSLVPALSCFVGRKWTSILKSGPIQTKSHITVMGRSSSGAAVAALCGVAAACVLLMAGGIGRPAAQAELLGFPGQYPEQQLAAEELPERQTQLGLRASSYVRRWSQQAEVAAAAMSPKKQILALKAQGVPIIFPSKVTDQSGNLQKMVCAPQYVRVCTCIQIVRPPLWSAVRFAAGAVPLLAATQTGR